MPKGFLGSHHTEEAKLKNRLAHLGKHHSKESRKRTSASLKGRRVSGETRQKMSLAQKGRIITPEARMKISKATKRLWENPKWREEILSERNFRARLAGLLKRPTKPEQKLIELLEKTGLPFRYVGDGKLIIDGKCPDFVNVNGKKQLIELFGVYWHNLFDVAERTEHFRQYGFQTLIIWEDELNNTDKVIHKIKMFTRK